MDAIGELREVERLRGAARQALRCETNKPGLCAACRSYLREALGECAESVSDARPVPGGELHGRDPDQMEYTPFTGAQRDSVEERLSALRTLLDDRPPTTQEEVVYALRVLRNCIADMVRGDALLLRRDDR